MEEVVFQECKDDLMEEIIGKNNLIDVKMAFKSHPGKNIYRIRNRFSQTYNKHVIVQ